MKIYIALIHYPVFDKNKRIITSSIVPYDIVDMSRASKTFNVKNFYVVHPYKNQRDTIKRVIKFWTLEKGSFYNEDRKKALELVKIKRSLKEVIKEIKKIEGIEPKIVLTCAKKYEENISYEFLKSIILKFPVLILFGTGWGIVKEKIMFDYILEPILGFPINNEYNHLTVRSACSIILDRICNLFRSSS
ncbi:MAG: RNA methyltransferase [Caldisericia bacterium]